VLVFVDHYLDLLETRFMNDERLDELCRQIYKNHRQALDLIWDRIGSPEAGTLVEVLNIIEHDSRWHVLYRSSRYVYFIPTSWLQWLPPIGDDDYYLLCVHFRSRETKLSYTMFVGPMEDLVKRKQLVTKLREEAVGVGFKRSRASTVAEKWSRVCAAETILEWGEEDEPEPELIRRSVKKKLDDLYPKLEKLASVVKSLL
jgi:hypothetical protein